MGDVDKSAVVRVLREIALLLQLSDENAFKSRAYEIGADRISGLTDDLGEWVRTRRLRELPGIGAALEEKITELVTTGKLAYYEQLKANYPPGILELVKVPDLGPKKARVLWEQLQIADVDELERACREGKVGAVKGFGPKSQAKILAGIDLFRKSRNERRHKLADALPLSRQLLSTLQQNPAVIRASAAGSVRRFCETVSDLDFVASSARPAEVITAFAQHPDVAQVLAQGETKCSVRFWKDELQADLRVVPDEDYATALHHFTGSKSHHIRLRGLAQDRGLKISEWGISRGDEKLPVPDEATLYRLLDMQEVPPELREDWGEVEAALAGTLPSHLLTREDIAGITHSHTTWSDGKNSLEEMALAAQALGVRYLTVTDHSQSAHYAGGLNEDDLKRQWAEIDRVNEKLTRLRLLKGSEVDILEDGSLDFPDALLEQLEVVIGSIHQRHHLDEEQMTQRVLNAFDNPHLHVLGHPTGRLIQTREPYGLKMEAVLDKAAQKGVAIEVNGSPHRMDIKADYVRMALERKVKLVASTDAHSTFELDRNLTFAVGVARKGWAQRDDVLNALPVTAFLDALHSMRH